MPSEQNLLAAKIIFAQPRALSTWVDGSEEPNRMPDYQLTTIGNSLSGNATNFRVRFPYRARFPLAMF
jgi:hypothetical protein